METQNIKSLCRFFAVIITLAFLPIESPAFGEWWQCSSRVGGDWSFGRAPFVCLVDHMQTQNFVKDQYGPLIFDDTKPRTTERSRYITELHALAQEISVFYLNKRKPGVSQGEMNAFSLGLLALMHQETVWSHYRLGTDGRARYMRGDVGHGHGLMQVDDRSHQTALLEGRGADLVYNMMYGLDVFYSAWQRAPNQSCVNGPTDYTARIRSAWAAYNGGPARLCRWTSSTGPYAHHDRDFFTKLRNESWMNHVLDANLKPAIDISCMADGVRPCSSPNYDPIDTPIAGELYKINSGSFCILKNNSLNCVDQIEDVNCLQLQENKIYPNVLALSQQGEDKFPKSNLDRNNLCLTQVQGLIPTTSQIELHKNIILRKTPGGEYIKTLKSGDSYKSLDFKVTTTRDEKRYYKVSDQGSTGYVYAGDAGSFAEWVTEVEDSGTPQLVANIDDTIKVVGPYGINLRATPNGTLVTHIPKGEELVVVDRVVQGSQNYLYYGVQYSGRTGYIYSGYLDNPETISQWTEVQIVEQNLFALSESVPYRFLKECPQEDCHYARAALVSKALPLTPDQVRVLETQGEWSLVTNLDQSKQGWLKTSELVHSGDSN